MKYSVRSKDGTRAVFENVETDDLFVFALDLCGGLLDQLFVTDDRDRAYEAWQMVGGDYGEFEVVREDA